MLFVEGMSMSSLMMSPLAARPAANSLGRECLDASMMDSRSSPFMLFTVADALRATRLLLNTGIAFQPVSFVCMR